MVFSGPNNHLEVLDKYVDRKVLPPCICSGGNGKVARDMPERLEGGLIPEKHVSFENEKKPMTEATVSGDDSSSSVETCSVSDGDSFVRSHGSCQSRSIKVRCKRIVGGFWATRTTSTSKVVQVVC